MVEVKLEWFEYVGAVDVALRRFAASEQSGMNHAATLQRSWLERLRDEVGGAAAERAFCKWRGIYWDGSVNTFHHLADAGRSCEIRWTWRGNGKLIIRDNDADDRFYFLVTGEPPLLCIQGYLRGVDAKQPKWLVNPNGHRESWFVPQQQLVSV